MTDHIPNSTVEQAYNLGATLRNQGATHVEMVDELMANGFAKSLSEHIAKDMASPEHDELHPHDEMIELGWILVSFGVLISLISFIVFKTASITLVIVLIGFIAVGYGRYLDSGLSRE